MNQLIAIAVFAGGLALLAAALVISTIRRSSGAPVDTSGAATAPRDPDGFVVIPVTGTYTTGRFGAFSKNSFNGALAIGPAAIRFKVLATGVWSFAEIERIDVRKTLFGASLVFVNRGGGRTLVATVRDLDAARRALAALPRGVPLTPKAAIIRDG